MNSHKVHPFCAQLKYENTKSKKFKNNIGKRENMIYNKITDTYTCANNKELKFISLLQASSIFLLDQISFIYA